MKGVSVVQVLYSLIIFFLFRGSYTALGNEVKPNVLFIVIDDLRPSISCYGGPIISPNIDQLASRSALFTNAMVQQSVCAPSRTSFLTSRRPDTTKLYDFGSYWRTHAGNYTTLPQHFKENGYFTASVGKVFHPGVTCGGHDDYPYSWSIPAYHPSTEAYIGAKVCSNPDGTLHNNVMCPVNVSDMPEKSLPDLQAHERASYILKQLSSAQHDGNMTPPFFLAVGYRKPHIPWKYPKEFKDLYPIESVAIASNPHRSPTQPDVAYEDYFTLRKREDINALNMSFPFGTIPLDYHAPMRQNYYAATSYTDLMVGKLLQDLDDYGFSNNTIIVFFGDHGWQLGEHAEWCKYVNYELGTRVPLIVHVPGVTDGKRQASPKFPLKNPLTMTTSKENVRQKAGVDHVGAPRQESSRSAMGGMVVDEFVEMVDLFPTLSDLAGIPVPPVCPPKPFKVALCSEGYSFAPLLTQTGSRNTSSGCESKTSCANKSYKRWKNATFSQYPRPGVEPNQDTDLPSLKKITVMGYSMRTADYHYTEWIGFSPVTFEGDWNDVKARELYINALDYDQNENVAGKAEYKELVEELSNQLQRGWRDSLPVGD